MKSRIHTISAIFLTSLLIPLSANAAIIFNDTFTDGARTNGADAQDIAWYQLNATALSVGSDAVIGGGNVLIANSSGGFNRIVGVFGGVTIAVGETLQLSFDMRFSEAPVSSASTLRIAIYNNGGTAFTADSQTSLETDDFGYGFATNPGSASASGTQVASEAAGSAILSGSSPSGFATFGSAGASINWGTTSAHSVIYSITRLGDGTLDLSTSIDGGIAATGNIAAINSNYTFNQIAFGQGSIDRAYVLDNVQLSVIPEPSTVLLGGLGAILLLRRRR